MRSATAQIIYTGDPRFKVKSAGTDKSAAIVLTYELLDWANAIVVMEKDHRNFIRKHFKEVYNSKKIVCLYIPDEFEFMQPELIEILKTRFENVYTRGLLFG